MDKISKIIRNLEYQKLNFEDVYNSYLDDVKLKLEVAATEYVDVYVNKHEKIVILCDNYGDVLDGIFYINMKNESISKPLENYNSIVIEKSYSADGEIFERENSLHINLSHQYTLDGIKIEIITKLKKDTLENATALLVAKKINLFDKKIIKERDIRVIEIVEINQIKEKLLDYKGFYCEKKFIEDNLKIKPINSVNLNLDETDNFKITISLDYIKKFTNSSKDDYISIISQMEKNYKKTFLKNANEIIAKALDDSFKNNYLKFDLMFDEYDKLNKLLIKEEKKFLQNIDKILDELSDSSKYLEIANSGIEKFDKITAQCLDSFSNKMFEVMIEGR